MCFETDLNLCKLSDETLNGNFETQVLDLE